MVTNATALHRSGKTDPAAAWQLVVRAAVGASLMAAALVYALHTFVHWSDPLVVAVVALGGLLLGLRLPAAQPPIPGWLLDEHERIDELS
jgi:ABC-type enterobactin transport system permease subunit